MAGWLEMLLDADGRVIRRKIGFLLEYVADEEPLSDSLAGGAGSVIDVPETVAHLKTIPTPEDD